MSSRISRRTITLSALLGLVLLAALAAFVAIHVVRARVADWLQPDGRAAAIEIGWQSLTLRDVTLVAPDDWPARQSLRAARVDVSLDWLDLFSDQVLVRRIVIQDFQLAVARLREGGIDILPTVRRRADQKADEQGAAAPRAVRIEQVQLMGGRVDFHDAVVTRPAHTVSFDRVEASLGPLAFPLQGLRTQVEMTGRQAGDAPGGEVAFKGWVELGAGDADIDTRLQGANIRPLAPYLKNGGASAIAGGRLDLTMRTKVADRKLDAAGEAVLYGLRLRDEGLAGLPRKAVLGALQDEKGRLRFRYTVTGAIDDPRFEIDSSLTAQLAGGLVEAVGLGIGGIANGVAGAVHGLAGVLSGR